MLKVPSTRDQLITDNIDLVRFHARQLHARMPQLDMDDVIQEGSLGLITAAGEFDPDRGASFRTYASFRIRGAIIDSMRAEWRHQAFDAMPDEVIDCGPDLEQVAAAQQLLDRLSPRERQLVIRRYYDGSTQREVGRAMSISHGRVSQIESAAISRMRSSALRPAVQAAA